MTTPVVFISYSHRDEPWKDQLQTQLGVLAAEGLLDSWDDRRIGAGDAWHEEIDAAIQAARVAILLITAHFLTSKFILNEEVPRLLARPGLRVFPVLADYCPWQRVAWLAQMQLRPVDARPLSGMPAHQATEALSNIALEVAAVLDAKTGTATGGASEPVPPARSETTLTEQVRPAAAESAPPPPMPVEHTRVAKASEVITQTTRLAGGAVRTIAETIRDEEVRRVIEQFLADFASVSRVIDDLTNYKALHDELHNLEFHCYNDIRALAPRLGQDEMVRGLLVEREITLLAFLNQMRAIADQAAFADKETSWIDQIAKAHGSLREALDNETAGAKAISTTVLLLNRVLTSMPTRLSDRMSEKTSELDLRPLERALDFVRQRLLSRSYPQKTIDEVNAGVEALESLRRAVGTLIREHDQWQTVELDLRRLDISLSSSGIAEIELSWPALKEQVRPLYEALRDPAGTTLKTHADGVNAALDSDGPKRSRDVIDAFRRFRRQAGDHFYRIDASVRDSFGKLGKVGEPLLLILRMIEAG